MPHSQLYKSKYNRTGKTGHTKERNHEWTNKKSRREIIGDGETVSEKKNKPKYTDKEWAEWEAKQGNVDDDDGDSESDQNYKLKEFVCNGMQCKGKFVPRENFSDNQLKGTAAKYRECKTCIEIGTSVEHELGLECRNCKKKRGSGCYRSNVKIYDVNDTDSDNHNVCLFCEYKDVSADADPYAALWKLESKSKNYIFGDFNTKMYNLYTNFKKDDSRRSGGNCEENLNDSDSIDSTDDHIHCNYSQQDYFNPCSPNNIFIGQRVLMRTRCPKDQKLSSNINHDYIWHRGRITGIERNEKDKVVKVSARWVNAKTSRELKTETVYDNLNDYETLDSDSLCISNNLQALFSVGDQVYYKGVFNDESDDQAAAKKTQKSKKIKSISTEITKIEEGHARVYVVDPSDETQTRGRWLSPEEQKELLYHNTETTFECTECHNWREKSTHLTITQKKLAAYKRRCLFCIKGPDALDPDFKSRYKEEDAFDDKGRLKTGRDFYIEEVKINSLRYTQEKVSCWMHPESTHEREHLKRFISKIKRHFGTHRCPLRSLNEKSDNEKECNLMLNVVKSQGRYWCINNKRLAALKHAVKYHRNDSDILDSESLKIHVCMYRYAGDLGVEKFLEKWGTDNDGEKIKIVDDKGIEVREEELDE